MTANDSKPYLTYLNKLVDQYNNTYHLSMNKILINADYSSLNEKIETNTKAFKLKYLKLMIESKLLENWLREIFIIDSALKTNPWTYKTKDLDREKIIGSFYEK